MPCQPRLDAPGALPHVMGRGLERTPVFREDTDRADFIARLAALCGEAHLVASAWALLPTNFHATRRACGRASPRGGGLLRSLGGWAQGLALRRKGLQVAADARILGRGDFTARLLAEAARYDKATLRLPRKVMALAPLARRVSAGAGVAKRDLRSGSRRPTVVRAHRLFCQVAVQGMGDSGAGVARFLGVTTSAANRLTASEALPEVKQYLKAL